MAKEARKLHFKKICDDNADTIHILAEKVRDAIENKKRYIKHPNLNHDVKEYLKHLGYEISIVEGSINNNECNYSISW